MPGFEAAIEMSTQFPVWTYPIGGTMSLSAEGVLCIVKDDGVTAISAFQQWDGSACTSRR